MKSTMQTNARRSVSDVRRFMARHISSTRTVRLQGELVGAVRGTANKRWLTLMSGEDFIHVEAPRRYCPHRLTAGQLIALTAKPRFEQGDKEVIWCVDESPTVDQRTTFQVLSGVGPIEANRRKTVKELNLPSRGNKELDEINPSGMISNVLVVCGQDSQVQEDFERALFEKTPKASMNLRVVETSVQGPKAKLSIPSILRDLRPGEADVVVVIRGGGSYSDFVVFDDKDIVQAVSDCAIPVVTALGHSEHVPLVSRASAANFEVPLAAGTAIRMENSKRYFAGRPSVKELLDQNRSLRAENQRTAKKLAALTIRRQSLESELHQSHETIIDVEISNRALKNEAIAANSRVCSDSLQLALNAIGMKSMVNGLWWCLWSALTFVCAVIDTGVPVLGTLLLPVPIVSWAVLTFTGHRRGQKVVDALEGIEKMDPSRTEWFRQACRSVSAPRHLREILCEVEKRRG